MENGHKQEDGSRTRLPSSSSEASFLHADTSLPRQHPHPCVVRLGTINPMTLIPTGHNASFATTMVSEDWLELKTQASKPSLSRPPIACRMPILCLGSWGEVPRSPVGGKECRPLWESREFARPLNGAAGARVS